MVIFQFAKRSFTRPGHHLDSLDPPYRDQALGRRAHAARAARLTGHLDGTCASVQPTDSLL